MGVKVSGPRDVARCEVCGKPATALVQAVRQTAAVQDSEGEWWAAFEPEGEPRMACKQHSMTRK
jgi:hypothetical protein